MTNQHDQDCNDPLSDCSKAKQLVDSYIDNMLSESQESFINQHLLNCKGCCEGFSFETSLIQRVRSIAPETLPINFRENILLALGFPGMSEPIGGSLATRDVQEAIEQTGMTMKDTGIPKGRIPRGQIPKSGFFKDDSDQPPYCD